MQIEGVDINIGKIVFILQIYGCKMSYLKIQLSKYYFIIL